MWPENPERKQEGGDEKIIYKENHMHMTMGMTMVMTMVKMTMKNDE